MGKAQKAFPFLAIYAAAISTLGLLWNIYQYKATQPKLKVDIFDASVSWGSADSWKGTFGNSNPAIRFINQGSKPLTIYLAQAEFASNLPKLPQKGSLFEVHWDQVPIKLDAGEVHEWRPWGGNAVGDRFEGKARLIVLTTEGKYEKEWPVVIHRDLKASLPQLKP